jgi:transposase-like protein
MTDVFSAPHFRDDKEARKVLEGILWPSGPVCCHCGVIGHAYPTKREGMYRCAEAACRKDFTVTMRTVMERSKIALHKWLQAFALMTASKKGISAHQLHRTLDIGYEAAWFMAHRIREAMRDGGLSPLGGGGKIVEADETYYGPSKKMHVSPQRTTPYTKRGKFRNNRPIVSLVERGGRVRSFHAAVADKAAVTKIVTENIARESRLHTDESRLYIGADAHFDAHKNRASHVEGIRAQGLHFRRKRRDGHRRDGAHQFSRRLLLDFQTRHERHLPLRRKAFASVSGGI